MSSLETLFKGNKIQCLCFSLIWTKCDCVFFLTLKLCFDTMALLALASLVVGARSYMCQKNVNNKMNNHILFICYTIQQIHQILKFSSCFLDNLSSIIWFMTRICSIQYFSWYRGRGVGTGETGKACASPEIRGYLKSNRQEKKYVWYFFFGCYAPDYG